MNELEKALVALSPAPSRLDRDALMYSAGRTATPRRWLWPTVACGFAVVSAVLGVRLAMQEPRIVENAVFIRDEAPSRPIQLESASMSESFGRVEDSGGPMPAPYLELERETLRRGDLPMSYPASAAPPGPPAWPSLEKELDLPPARLRSINHRSTSF